MTIELSTTNETAIQPSYDSAKSALSKAQGNLVNEQSALSEAQAALDAVGTLPKNAAHDGAELEGAVTFYGRRVSTAEKAVSEAQATLDQAHHNLAEAKVLDRTEALAEFDRDEWAAEFAAEVQEVADRYMGDLYAVRSWEAEGITQGKSIGLDGLIHNTENRARVVMDSSWPVLTLDGRKLHAPYPSLGLDYLRESIRDTRHDEWVAEAQREEGERRRQEEAERKAEREYA